MLDAVDRRIIAATQNGLPLTARPYAAVAEAAEIAETEAIARLGRLLACGAIRRIGVIPNHYALGLTANGMSVWDVDDRAVEEAGLRIGVLDFVTHCYERPRHHPIWPYNFFAMVHGRSRQEVVEKVERIAALLGPDARAHDILFSTRILKKTGLRIAA
jgi:DNA-binding Lrp family transcriptional regulator